MLDPDKVAELTALGKQEFKKFLSQGGTNTIWKLLVTELACRQLIDGEGFGQTAKTSEDERVPQLDVLVTA